MLRREPLGQYEDMGKWLKISRHCSVLVRFPKLRPSLARSLYPISLFSLANWFFIRICLFGSDGSGRSLCHQTAAWDCLLALLHERDWLTTRESTPVRGPCRLPWSCTSVLLLVVNLVRITRHPSLLLCPMKCCI
ncbi:hypothetical protein GW17_00043839 [Ensete ventricosum]|nr:hypothetical protein GW17_00043839 [Ensete ventricosum]RZR90496.1 hypothetical protein BHM03_00018394 [Ensete ventricosum]